MLESTQTDLLVGVVFSFLFLANRHARYAPTAIFDEERGTATKLTPPISINPPNVLPKLFDAGTNEQTFQEISSCDSLHGYAFLPVTFLEYY